MVALSFPAFGQEVQCGPRDRNVENLWNDYGETKAMQGRVDSKTVIEIFRNEETGTWTIIASDVDGKSCLVSSGDFWVHNPGKGPNL